MKAISKKVTKKLLAGLLTLAMICGIGPTYMTAKAETPSAVAYDYSSEHPDPNAIMFFSLSGAPAHTGGKVLFYATEGGIYVDGEVGSRSWFFREGESYCYIYWPDNGFSGGFANGTKVRIDGTFKADGGTTEFKLQGNFIYQDGQWLSYNEELEVSLNATQSGASWMFFTTATDATYMGSGDRQWPVIGGFYVKKASGTDYTLADGWFINHYGAGQYHVWRDAGFNFETGDEIYMDAWFGAAYDGPASRLVSPVWVLGENGWYVKQDVVEPFETTVSDYTGTSDMATHMFFATAADDGKFAGSRMHYFASEGGIYVNGNLLSTNRFMRDGAQYFIIYFPDLGVTEADGMTLRIDGVFASEDGTSVLDLTSGTFVYSAATGQWIMYNDEVRFSNNSQTGDWTCVRLVPNKADNLAADESWNARYSAIAGGVYLNGSSTPTPVSLIKYTADLYLIYWPDYGYPAANRVPNGTTLTIDGIFGDSTYAVQIKSTTLKLINNTWCEYSAVENDVAVVPYDADAFAGYRANLTAPTMTNYVFAGWYADEACTTALTANAVEEVAYAKFVDANVLTAKAQVTAGITDATDKADIRFVTTVDSLNYKEVGFYITIGDADQGKKVTKTVYSSLYIVGKDSNEVDTEITPDEFCKTSKYFATYSYWNVGKAHFGTNFTVTPYWVTLDGTTVCGSTSVRSVNMINAAYNQ